MRNQRPVLFLLIFILVPTFLHARSGNYAAAIDGAYNLVGQSGSLQLSRRLWKTGWINLQAGNGSFSRRVKPHTRSLLYDNPTGVDYQLNVDLHYLTDLYFSWRRPGSARWRIFHNAGMGVSHFKARAYEKVIVPGHPTLYRGQRDFSGNGFYGSLGLLRFRHTTENPYNFQLGIKSRFYKFATPLEIVTEDGQGSAFTAVWGKGVGKTWVVYPELYLRFEVLL